MNREVQKVEQKKTDGSAEPLSRREFIKTSAAVTAAMLAAQRLNGAYAAGSDRIRVGLIGCGGRGTGAASDCVNSSPNVELVAMGDLFQDHLDASRQRLAGLKEKYKVTDDHAFAGFDAYRKVIDSSVDLVLLCTPPAFRSIHLRAAVDAGKHVFMEKPVAVDPAGVRSVIESADLAASKKLGIVAGTQRRHEASYIETMKRIHDGAIGDIVSGQCYWNQGGLWMFPRQSGWSDVEWQIRNWLYFAWLSGDHIVEQHVHNLDVINWALRAHPVKALGMGGRQVRTDPAYGNIYDHFTIDLEYPNGVRVMSMCRQIDGTASRVSENLIGTKGTSNPAGSIRGQSAWRFEGQRTNPYVQEHTDLIASIRAGKPLNEGRQIAESTLTAIMGRMSAYTGQEVTWEQALNSKLDLVPKQLAFGPMPVDPVATPGKTLLV
jgi:predicted dehydrogenase